MNLEQAITTAIEFETKVHQTYDEAVAATADPVGKRIFGVLAREELEHIHFLEQCLARWREDSTLEPEELETALPSPELVQQGLERVQRGLQPQQAPRPREVELLRRAIAAESETTGFYRKMVAELGDEGRLFARFLEIEEGHLAIVSAELDSVTGLGYWFDVPEWQFPDG
jgi:rubrerythrin